MKAGAQAANFGYDPGARSGIRMAEYFYMGGYAGYVWPAYAISVLVIGALTFSIWRRGKRLSAQMQDRERHEAPAPSDGPQG